MAKLTLQDAEGTAQRNRPWSFRLEYNGASAVNQSGVSSKFWYATGRGTHEPVEIGWGAIGHAPQYQLITWTALVDRVKEKLAKGYDYVDVPYEKMSAANLAKITGGASPVVAAPVAPVAPVAPPTPVAPAAPAAPVVSTPAPQSLLSLGEPWSLIRSIKIIRKGTKVTGYQALDGKGDEVLEFDPQGGKDFAHAHNIDVVF